MTMLSSCDRYVWAAVLTASVVLGQDDFGGGEDAGGGEDMVDMDSMLAAGGGQGNSATVMGRSAREEELTYIEQTTRALQQLALVIGVAFLVAFLFMIMIGLEKIYDKLEERYNKAFGQPEPQEEDPAALVGTFKRYKN